MHLYVRMSAPDFIERLNASSQVLCGAAFRKDCFVLNSGLETTERAGRCECELCRVILDRVLADGLAEVYGPGFVRWTKRARVGGFAPAAPPKNLNEVFKQAYGNRIGELFAHQRALSEAYFPFD
jgi:hypothetical protein